jgi:hypothetical protein
VDPLVRRHVSALNQELKNKKNLKKILFTVRYTWFLFETVLSRFK